MCSNTALLKQEKVYNLDFLPMKVQEVNQGVRLYLHLNLTSQVRCYSKRVSRCMSNTEGYKTIRGKIVDDLKKGI